MLDSGHRLLGEDSAAESRRFGRITPAPRPGPYDLVAALADAAKPLLGATTQASVAGRFRSLRKYSKTVGLSGETAAKLLNVSYDARDDAGGRDIVPQNAAVHDLGEERGLRHEFVQQVGDILLAVGHEGFVVARASAEGDDDGFLRFAATMPRSVVAAVAPVAKAKEVSAVQGYRPADAEVDGWNTGLARFPL